MCSFFLPSRLFYMSFSHLLLSFHRQTVTKAIHHQVRLHVSMHMVLREAGSGCLVSLGLLVLLACVVKVYVATVGFQHFGPNRLATCKANSTGTVIHARLYVTLPVAVT